MILLSLTLGVVNCFVVIGNLLVFYVILTKKSLQTSTNHLVLSLTISDLLLGILILPFAIIQVKRLKIGKITSKKEEKKKEKLMRGGRTLVLCAMSKPLPG